ncbi:MAG: sialidase family protein [Planctomycetaceae bacterium]
MRLKLQVLLATLTLLAGVVSADDQAFLDPPAHVGAPRLPEHAVTNRAFQGIPSLALAPGGRLWANWYAGMTPGEDHNNYVVVSTSGDQGHTWREVLVIDPDGPGPVRTYDPELWLAPTGRLYVFWAQAIGHEGTVAGVWCVHTDEPDRETPRWSEPRRLTDGIMMCKPLVLSTGEWCLPASTWRKTDHSARMIVSADAGKTWSLRGAAHVPEEARQFDEHMLVERRDGSLWMLVRTKYGIGESVSTDRGQTWTEVKPSGIAHPSARFFISRLHSGNLLLVKHGPIDKPTGRSHLMAFVSRDEGQTWQGAAAG